jgi:phosphoglycolate phosphatase
MPLGTTPGACKLLIFDLDGTLIDSFADIRRSLVAAFERIGVRLDDEVMSLVHKGVGLEIFYEAAVGAASSDAAHRERFELVVAEYRRDYAERSESRPFPHARELLGELRRQRPQLQLALATAKRSDMAEGVLERSGLRPFFDVVRGTDELPHKPDPALLHEVCRRAGVATGDAVMVGDTDRDVRAAQAAPMTSVAIAHGGWTRPELAALSPCYLVDDLHALRALVLES